MSDVLIAWVADGNGDCRLHLDCEIRRGDLWGRWGERADYFVPSKDSRGCMYELGMEGGCGRVQRTCWGLACFPRKYLHVPALTDLALHCFVA